MDSINPSVVLQGNSVFDKLLMPSFISGFSVFSNRNYSPFRKEIIFHKNRNRWNVFLSNAFPKFVMVFFLTSFFIIANFLSLVDTGPKKNHFSEIY